MQKKKNKTLQGGISISSIREIIYIQRPSRDRRRPTLTPARSPSQTTIGGHVALFDSEDEIGINIVSFTGP